MIGDMTLIDKVNFLRPPGPGPDPSDMQAIAQMSSAVQSMTPNGVRTAFAFIVDQPAAQSDYRRYLAVAGALGIAIGAAAIFLVKR